MFFLSFFYLSFRLKLQYSIQYFFYWLDQTTASHHCCGSWRSVARNLPWKRANELEDNLAILEYNTRLKAAVLFLWGKSKKANCLSCGCPWKPWERRQCLTSERVKCGLDLHTCIQLSYQQVSYYLIILLSINMSKEFEVVLLLICLYSFFSMQKNIIS